jgi:ribosome recycling factor|tara:strand:- start:992 stop:1714 length:723 start_codon:yes stop_codon:yes gene_type:complete
MSEENVAEENVNDKKKIDIDVLKLNPSENTYIISSKERMFDVIKAFVENSQGSIALNDFSQIFKTVTVWVKFRPRKLGSYVEVMKERSTETTIDVRYSGDEYIPHIKEVLRDHKIKVKSMSNNVMTCQLPRPSDQDIDTAVQKVRVIANTARSSLSQVKADTIQRLQAAIKNEYLEAKDVKFALQSIEKVEQQMAGMLTYFRVECEKMLAGRKFTFDSPETKDMHTAIHKRIQKKFYIEI